MGFPDKSRTSFRSLDATASVACPWSFSGSWNDEIVPLICPTCQIFGPNRRMRRPPATLHGVVFDIFGESRGDGVINPASKNRRSYWVSGNRYEDPPMWLAGADEKPGRWWNDWISWLKPWAEEQLPARAAAGRKKRRRTDVRLSACRSPKADVPELSESAGVWLRRAARHTSRSACREPQCFTSSGWRATTLRAAGCGCLPAR